MRCWSYMARTRRTGRMDVQLSSGLAERVFQSPRIRLVTSRTAVAWSAGRLDQGPEKSEAGAGKPGVESSTAVHKYSRRAYCAMGFRNPRSQLSHPKRATRDCFRRRPGPVGFERA